MKYIRFSGGGFAIFPDTIQHDGIRVRGSFTGEPINAGKIQIYVRDDELIIHTYGNSTSLNLKANEEDGKDIKRMIEEY